MAFHKRGHNLKRDIICIFVLNSDLDYVGRYFRDSLKPHELDKINRSLFDIGNEN